MNLGRTAMAVLLLVAASVTAQTPPAAHPSQKESKKESKKESNREGSPEVGQKAGQKAYVEVSAERRQLDRSIAARFAPIFRQGLGVEPRADYITRFDYDGDWRGDNNWDNLDRREFPLRAYIYYSVAETVTHYFVHYAVFHPRDYKGGLSNSVLLDSLIRKGIERLGRDPTGGLANEVALSHENDLEGCLVVARKKGDRLEDATVEYVESLWHNRFLRYRPEGNTAETIAMEGGRPIFFIEAEGHGIERYTGGSEQLRYATNGVLTYVYKGRAGDPEAEPGETVGYDLVPIHSTFWKQALAGMNETYGEAAEYQPFSVLVAKLANPSGEQFKSQLGMLGSALRGRVGFENKARPPWGWFDQMEKGRPLGELFFDPATVIARHFVTNASFSLIYLYNPYLGIGLSNEARLKP